MDNVKDRNLSFPQRNWLWLCLLSAILSPLLLHFLQAGAKRRNYDSAIRRLSSDSARARDSSYNVASPPAGPGVNDSAAHK